MAEVSNEASNNGIHGQQTDAIEQLSALRATTDAQILTVIRAADESEVWQVDGSPNLVEWVTWRCRVSRSEARKLVEVAQALAELPRITAGLDDGSLSYTQVCLLADVVVGPQQALPSDQGQAPRRQGAVVDKALNRLVEQMPKLPNGIYENHERRRADALVELAATQIAEDADPDRATIVVHVEAEALVSDHGAAAIGGGCELAPRPFVTWRARPRSKW